jgi:dienelactone hydrolase
MKIIIFLLLVFGLVPAIVRAQDDPALDERFGEQIVRIPKQDRFMTRTMEATLFKPQGNGPFPLVIINHGKALGNPLFQLRARYLPVSRALVRRGFVVLMPMRKGFSKSDGHYNSIGCNIASNGEAQAEDVLAAIDYAKTLSFVDTQKIMVFGASHGGLATMALGSMDVPGLLGLVNFAGGLRNADCSAWETNLVSAFTQYGKSARYPSLWFYGENDSYWPTWLSAKMLEAYNRESGGKARMVPVGIFEDDAHMMFSKAKGLPIWIHEVGKFMQSFGLDFSIKQGMVPVTLKHPQPPESRFAEIGNVNAVPLLNAKGRDNYRLWLTMPVPRAFAISTSGGHFWASNDDYASDVVLDRCNEKYQQTCRLYAVDEDVVW